MIPLPSAAASVRKAMKIATKAHEGQTRASGEAYIEHPKAVAHILKEHLHAEPVTLCAALLHDVVEDTSISGDEIRTTFGASVADIVEGVTKLGKFEKDLTPNERNLESIRKMFRAMGKDLRVILIKLADRLHNMQTIEHLRPEKQKRIARETMDVFCPLADLLGIRRWYHELSDRSLQILNPMEYTLIERKRAEVSKEHLAHLQQWVESLQNFLRHNGLRGVHVELRRRHTHGVYRSMNGQWSLLNHIETFHRVYIVLPSQDDCYRALGRVHQFSPALPAHIRDYIAQPKTNNYQGLHTTVTSGLGNPIKIIIQSKEMNEIALFGVAQGFRLKQKNKDYWKKLPIWVERLVSLEQESEELDHFFGALQSEIFGERQRVHIVGRKERLLELPKHASILDAAFATGAKEGRSLTKAIVNGKESSLKHMLQNGDVVELVQSKRGLERVARDILVTRTFQAQKMLVQCLSDLPKKKQEERGKELLQETLDLLIDPFYPTSWKKTIQKNVLRKKESFAGVGRAEISPFRVIESESRASEVLLLDPELFAPTPRLTPHHRIRFILLADIEDLKSGNIIGRQTRPDVVEVMAQSAAQDTATDTDFSKEIISLQLQDKHLLHSPFVFALRWTFTDDCNPLRVIANLQNILDTPMELTNFLDDTATLRFHTLTLTSLRIAFEYLYSQSGITSIVRTSP